MKINDRSIRGIFIYSDDAVFAKVVSGRNIKGMDFQETVGAFINSVPERIRCTNRTVRELLQQVFSDDIESEKYDFCSLAEIQNSAVTKKDTIQTLFLFQNYLLLYMNNILLLGNYHYLLSYFLLYYLKQI